MGQRGKWGGLRLKFSHLLLDFDGTLVRKNPLMKAQFLCGVMAEQAHWGAALGVLRTAYTLHKKMVQGSEQQSLQQLAEQVFYEETGRDGKVYRELCDKALERASSTKVMRGAREFLYWAKKHFKLILATNPVFTRSQIQLRLEMAGIDGGDFVDLRGSEDFHFAKPHRGYYEELLSLYSLNASQCLMIGDDKKKDGPAQECGIELALRGVSPFPSFERLKQWIEEAR